jgi:hypothetical protein
VRHGKVDFCSGFVLSYSSLLVVPQGSVGLTPYVQRRYRGWPPEKDNVKLLFGNMSTLTANLLWPNVDDKAIFCLRHRRRWFWQSPSWPTVDPFIIRLESFCHKPPYRSILILAVKRTSNDWTERLTYSYDPIGNNVYYSNHPLPQDPIVDGCDPVVSQRQSVSTKRMKTRVNMRLPQVKTDLPFKEWNTETAKVTNCSTHLFLPR